MATWGFRKEDVGMAEEELGGDSVELCNKDVEIRDGELQDKGVKDGGWRRRRRQDGDMSQGSVCQRTLQYAPQRAIDLEKNLGLAMI